MIQTTRTVLRVFQKEDLSALHAYAKIEGIGESAGWKHHEYMEETEQLLHMFLKNTNTRAIVSKEEQKVIGHITVYEDSEEGRADTKELGFVLNPNYQNRGIMTEVVQAVLAHLFSNSISYVYACCFQNNIGSKRLIEKCGFQFDREGAFFSDSLNQNFLSYEYVFTKEQWDKSTANT